LRVIVDEDLASHRLVGALEDLLGAGHVVTLEKGLSDTALWHEAQRDHLAVLTQNAKDFVPLAEAFEHHGGLLLVTRHSDRAKDLTVSGIVERIASVAELYVDLTDMVLVVNGFNAKT
jgi:hypothetical protein